MSNASCIDLKWAISCFPLATISWIVIQIGNRLAKNVLGLLFSLASIWFNVAHTSASLCELFVLIELGDRVGLSRRARRLHKSRGTIGYFGFSIANDSMAEDGTKISRSRSPEAGCWSTNLNLHGEYGLYSGPRAPKNRRLWARGGCARLFVVWNDESGVLNEGWHKNFGVEAA